MHHLSVSKQVLLFINFCRPIPSIFSLLLSLPHNILLHLCLQQIHFIQTLFLVSLLFFNPSPFPHNCSLLTPALSLVCSFTTLLISCTLSPRSPSHVSIDPPPWHLLHFFLSLHALFKWFCNFISCVSYLSLVYYFPPSRISLSLRLLWFLHTSIAPSFSLLSSHDFFSCSSHQTIQIHVIVGTSVLSIPLFDILLSLRVFSSHPHSCFLHNFLYLFPFTHFFLIRFTFFHYTPLLFYFFHLPLFTSRLSFRTLTLLTAPRLSYLKNGIKACS